MTGDFGSAVHQPGSDVCGRGLLESGVPAVQPGLSERAKRRAAGTGGARQPFPNNQVPINSKVASSLVASKLFTTQEESPTYFTSGYVHSYQGDMKIDWQASQSDHITGRYSQMYTINTSTTASIS